jgi:hypothetical protein
LLIGEKEACTLVLTYDFQVDDGKFSDQTISDELPEVCYSTYMYVCPGLAFAEGVTLKQCILYSGTAKCRDISLFRL